MKSDTETIIKALRILARDIQSDDGVANAAIAEAADRLQEQQERIRLLISERDSARRQADQNWKLREELEALLGTSDVQDGVRRIKEQQDHIKRLEGAGSLALGYAAKSDLESADEVWNKAKESKP